MYRLRYAYRAKVIYYRMLRLQLLMKNWEAYSVQNLFSIHLTGKAKNGLVKKRQVFHLDYNNRDNWIVQHQQYNWYKSIIITRESQDRLPKVSDLEWATSLPTSKNGIQSISRTQALKLARRLIQRIQWLLIKLKMSFVVNHRALKTPLWCSIIPWLTKNSKVMKIAWSLMILASATMTISIKVLKSSKKAFLSPNSATVIL